MSAFFKKKNTIHCVLYPQLLRRSASSYLPSDSVIADDGSLRLPPPVICFFGPFDNQTRVQLDMFESRKMCTIFSPYIFLHKVVTLVSKADFIPESKSHIFNTGTPVWGLDWCPIHADDRSCPYSQSFFMRITHNHNLAQTVRTNSI
jgi:transcription factor C subunit 6